MSTTNIGLNSGFKKKIAPLALTSFIIGSGSTGGGTNPPIPPVNTGDYQTLLNSSEFHTKILNIIRSLGESEYSVENDGNPLDNIIKDEVIQLLNYRKISKYKIQDAIDRISRGLDPYTEFNVDENLVMLMQAKELEFILTQDYNLLLTNPVQLYHSFPQAYMDVLNFQLNLPNNIPTIEELKIAGIIPFIIDTVKANPEAVIDENLVKYYTEHYIDTVLLSSEFIGYSKASKILADPDYILSILEKSEFINLFNRVSSYLPFITQEKIDNVLKLLPSQARKITNIFTTEQIRLVIDKELDIKNIIMKSMSVGEVTNLFNKLTATFKADFTETYTDEKMIGLIQIAVETMFPPKTTIEIYNNIYQSLGLDNPSEQKVMSIEEYMTQYYS